MEDARPVQRATFFATLLLAACSTATPAPPAPAVSSAPAASAPPASPPPTPLTAAVSAALTAAPAEPPPQIELFSTLFPDVATTPPSAPGCLKVADPRDRTLCMFTTRYEGDREAAQIAIDLFDANGSVAGVQVEQDMDGGFRGKIHLVPEVPIHRYRKHLAWVAEASRGFDAFFEGVRGAARGPVRYRHRPLAFRFFRSVKRTTPSAYAEGWTVSYNVSGSLHGSADAVRETLFHEIFHLNDGDHGDWSKRALGEIFDAIVARCGTKVACLKPYAPGDTMVRGGTYYAFQPDNGESVHEYAAELAGRYFREQRAAMKGEPLGRPAFKCGPEENRRAWEALVAEFFGGADSVPPCR
jgi:hypothetical protein